jgi:hypothetical protein
MCPILKKLTRKLQPYQEVVELIKEILNSPKGNVCRVLEHLLSFAEHQFGKGVPGKHCRETEDGERISNWIEDIILHAIIQSFSNLYSRDNSLSTIVQDDMRFPYLERSLSLLNPWVINLDSDASSGTDSLNEVEMNYLVKQLY